MGNICGGSGKADVAEDFRPSSPGEEGRSQEPVFISLSPVNFSCDRFNSWILLRFGPILGKKRFPGVFSSSFRSFRLQFP